jgi:transcriptional regulator with XRE-family HTH domain
MPKKKRMSRQRKEVDTSTYEGRFAVRLKTLREKAGLTPEQVAETLETSATSVYRWEAGLRQPQIADLPRIADALGVKPRTLIPEK